MSADEMVSRIERDHWRRLRDFRQELFGAPGDLNREGSTGLPAMLGPVPSLTDRHTRITVGGTYDVDADALYGVDWLNYAASTLSVAGTNRALGTRQRVGFEEALAWASAVVGESWARALYTTDTRSAAGAIATPYFIVFIGRDGAAREVPDPGALFIERVAA